MKSLIFISIVVIAVSCNFSKGVKKDLNTGLTSSWNGFSVDEVYLVNASGEKLSSNKVKFGSEVSIVANGVENYQLKNDKAFPGLKLSIVDKDGKSILGIDDAYASLTDGASENDAKTLTASYTIGSPMEVGKEYKLSAKFYDKQKNESVITSEVNVVVE